MATQIVGAIVLALTLALGIYKWIARVKSERRKLADEAGEKLEEAQKNKDKSGRIDAWMRANRASRM